MNKEQQIKHLQEELKLVRSKIRTAHLLEIFLFRKIKELKGIPGWVQDEVERQNQTKL